MVAGEVHLRRGDETKASGDFRETIAVARRVGSKAYELRATTSLARLLAKQGKRDEARAMLAEIYNATQNSDAPKSTSRLDTGTVATDRIATEGDLSVANC